MSLQKQRIVHLEHELKKKDQLIDKMKAHKWAKAKVKVPESLALKPLKKKIAQKKWIQALKLSGRLKKRFPRSYKLARYRYLIFKKMGLTKQALNELGTMKKLQARGEH